MKTTLNLPDDLMRAVKLRAVEENRRLTDMITDLLRRGLAQEPAASPAIPSRVRLPLVECAHEARPDAEMTPERVAEVLLGEERAVRQRRFLASLDPWLDLDVLASEQMWR